MKKIVAAMLMTAGLVACSSTKGPADETRGWPIERLYGEARDELNSGNYTRAVQLYETLEARFPYGRYAQQAQMDLAYAHYKDKESQMALAACDRFIKLHPNHPNVDYVYYLRGLVNFNEDLGLLGLISQQDMTERDPKGARESFDSFRNLVTRFPDSKRFDLLSSRRRPTTPILSRRADCRSPASSRRPTAPSCRRSVRSLSIR